MILMARDVKPEHKPILSRIRELFVKSGGVPLYQPEHFGLNTTSRSRTGGLEVQFDYGVPSRLFTSDGYYVILGSNTVEDVKAFWDLFTRAFQVEILEPQRDDAEVRKRDEFEYLTSQSGPYVRIAERV